MTWDSVQIPECPLARRKPPGQSLRACGGVRADGAGRPAGVSFSFAPRGLALVTLLLIAPMQPSSGAAEAPQSPEVRASVVVLVTIDTLRADAVSFMGNPLETTPFLDSLARAGVVFDRAYSNSWTVPSMASMFTSLYATSHGVVSGQVDKKRGNRLVQPILPGSIPTLAEVFRRAGYRTIGVAANRHLRAGTGFERGFEEYTESARYLTADQLNDEVRSLLKEAFGPTWRTSWQKSKTFLWIHYFDPHLPYYSREPWISRYAPDYKENSDNFPPPMAKPELLSAYESFTEVAPKLRAQYLSEVSYLDQYVQQIFEELGIGDTTLVMLTADHGEEIDDHGGIAHGRTLFDETIHVPMLIRWPQGISRQGVVHDTVTVLDVAPTLLELAGLEAPKSSQGRSLAPLVRDENGWTPSPSFVEQLPPREFLEAVVDGNWKLIQPLAEGTPPMLFDLQADPHERNDLRSFQPQQVARLEALLRRWRGELPPAPEAVYFDSDDQELVDQLRALGYVE